MKYRKKPVLLEATQWFKNGDHPKDRSVPVDTPKGPGDGKLAEGHVVKFFLSLDIPGGRFCAECGNVMQHHGLLNNELALNPDEVVHPGDYIVTNAKGKYYAQRPETFEALYEEYEPPARVEQLIQ